MNLQRHTLAIEDMEWSEELTDADLQAIVGGIGGTVDNVVEGTASAAGQTGRSAGTAIDDIQAATNGLVDRTQTTVAGVGILLSGILRGAT